MAVSILYPSITFPLGVAPLKVFAFLECFLFEGYADSGKPMWDAALSTLRRCPQQFCPIKPNNTFKKEQR